MSIITAKTRLANPRKARSTARPAKHRVIRRNKLGQIVSNRRATRAALSSRAHRKPARTALRRKRPTAARRNPALIYTLGTLNPHKPAKRRASGSRPMKGKVSMARKRSTRRRSTSARRRTSVRRRVARRNPVAAVRRRTRRRVSVRRRRRNPMVMVAPRRRRYSRRRNSARRVSVGRRRRRNPSVLGSRIGSPGSMKVVLAGLIGVMAVKVVGKYVPVQLRQFGGLGDAAIIGAIAIGAGMVAGKFFGSSVAEAVTFGGLMMAGSSLINSFAPNLRVMDVPLALSGYGGNGMGMFMPARFPVPQNPITAGYMPPAPPAQVSGLAARAYGRAL